MVLQYERLFKPSSLNILGEMNSFMPVNSNATNLWRGGGYVVGGMSGNV